MENTTNSTLSIKTRLLKRALTSVIALFAVTFIFGAKAYELEQRAAAAAIDAPRLAHAPAPVP